MSQIIFVMGPTCAGKSTFLDAARDFYEPGDVGFVEVGKMMRAKYPPSYFAGMAAPKHTAHEAWEMCEGKIDDHRSAGKRIVFVDGQPRDEDQARNACTFYPKAKFVWLNCPLALRETRGSITRDPEEYATLTKPRLTNDMIQGYETLWILTIMGRASDIYCIDTSNEKNLKPRDLFGYHLAALGTLMRSGA
jgi:hypothetical protein